MLSWVLLVAVLLILAGGAVAWWLSRASRTRPRTENTPDLGYGRERWGRELALWEGTLRRLQTQAARYEEPPSHLRSELARAEARIARARAALDESTSPPT